MIRVCLSSALIARALAIVLFCTGLSAQEESATTKTHEPQLIPWEPCPSSVLDLDLLVSFLGSDYATERWAAAECLGELKDARAVEPLVRAIFKE